MQKLATMCFVWLIMGTCGSGQYYDCRVPTFCKQRDGDTANIWSDLQGNVVYEAPPAATTTTAAPTTEQPPPPPPIPGVLDPSMTDNEQIAALIVRINKLKEPGWINGQNGYQYWVSPRNLFVPYATAELVCHDKDAQVAYATLRDPASRKFVVDEILKRCADSHGFWIDLSDEATEGTFIWGDGTIATNATTDWAENQPDNHNNADCAVIARYFDYKFDDVPCTATNGVLCERYVG